MIASILDTSAVFAPACADKADGEILYASATSGTGLSQLTSALREINEVLRGEATVPALVVTALVAGGQTWPAADGSAGQVLITDGAGNLSWSDTSGGMVPVTRTIATAGGLTGGGDLSADRTILLPDTIAGRTFITACAVVTAENVAANVALVVNKVGDPVAANALQTWARDGNDILAVRATASDLPALYSASALQFDLASGTPLILGTAATWSVAHQGDGGNTGTLLFGDSAEPTLVVSSNEDVGLSLLNPTATTGASQYNDSPRLLLTGFFRAAEGGQQTHAWDIHSAGLTTSAKALYFEAATVEYARLETTGGGLLAVPNAFTAGGAVTIGGALDHDGSTIGFFGHSLSTQASAYTPTSVTTDRSFDADTVDIAELADVVGTLIADLQSYGLLQ